MKYYIFHFLLVSMQAYAQNLPLGIAPLSNLNNYWVYQDYSSGQPGGFETLKIIDTAKYIDSIKYLEIEAWGFHKTYYRLREDGYYVMRRDSVHPEPYHEQRYYKKNAIVGDNWETVAVNSDSLILFYSIVDSLSTTVFGKPSMIKILKIRDTLLNLTNYEMWTEEFGRIAVNAGDGYDFYLNGCIINDTLYGDTSTVTVGVKTETEEMDYKLFQNYPNPFNSTTNIEYHLQEENFISLSIFSFKGELIKTLVNEIQTKGKYKIVFNAENLTSGVYLGVINIGKKSSIKKLLLIK
jgi:hypothetical protein